MKRLFVRFFRNILGKTTIAIVAETVSPQKGTKGIIKLTHLLSAASLLLIGSISYGESAFTGKVTVVASSQLYVQNAVIFQLDKGNADCASGQYIYYRSTGDDLKAMYATVLAAKLSGTPIWVHFTTSNCVTDGIALF